MSTEPRPADQASESVIPPSDTPADEIPVGRDEFHTDKMIVFTGVVGVLATIAFILTVVSHFLYS